jgi:transposase
MRKKSGRDRFNDDERCARQSAGSAIRYNPPLAAFYRRLRGRGKLAKVALTAVMRELLTILNAMLKHHTGWSAPCPV